MNNKKRSGMEYFPFGERRSPREHHSKYFIREQTFIEERNGTEYTNYLYNGKELDEETGLYYYGARYYDPRISIFYGVDPLNETYDFQSPFAYAANNPIRFIDWMGMSPIDENENIVDKTNQVTPAIDESLDGAPGGKREAQFRDDAIIISPMDNPVVTSEQSEARDHPVLGETKAHNGIDIVDRDVTKTEGKDVKAPANGEITMVRTYEKHPNGAGNRIHMKDKFGNKHSFFHLQDGTMTVEKGQEVTRGQVIGKAGSSGIGTGPHLHYETRDKNGNVQNPRSMNSGLKNAPTADVARRSSVRFMDKHSKNSY